MKILEPILAMVNDILLMLIFFTSIYSLIVEVTLAKTEKLEWFYRFSFGSIAVGSFLELLYPHDVFLAVFRIGVLAVLLTILKIKSDNNHKEINT